MTNTLHVAFIFVFSKCTGGLQISKGQCCPTSISEGWTVTIESFSQQNVWPCSIIYCMPLNHDEEAWPLTKWIIHIGIMHGDVCLCASVPSKSFSWNDLYHCHVLTLVPLLCLCVSLVRAWVGVGSLCSFFYVVFLCLAWYVLNQRQLSIVVSDWESYLGSLFSPFWLWVIVFSFFHTELFRFQSV